MSRLERRRHEPHTDGTQRTDGVDYGFEYGYHKGWSLKRMRYPSGSWVRYTPDAAERVAVVDGLRSDETLEKSHWQGVQYAPQGALKQVTLGNALIERWSFSTQRQQPWEVKLGTAANGASHLQLQFNYCGGYTDASCASNNGNILGQWNYAPNRIQTYSYDAENRPRQVTGAGMVTYAYDGDGRRVKKTASGVSTVYVYNAAGELAVEYGGPAQTPGTRYLTTDHLGSTRLVIDASGNVLSRHDYLPFGEEIPAGVGGRTTGMGYVANPAVTEKFTGKERDAETGLDFMEARYYSGAQGRFTSPDEPLFDQQAGDPQSWNLYAYGRNNPLRYLDPTGRKCVETSNGPADDGTGGGCAAAGVDANGNIQSQQVNVTAQQGSLLAAIGIGAFIGVSNAANDYFAWMFSSRPATLQNIDPGNNRATTTAAMIAPFLIPGPKGGQATKLLSAGRARPILTQEALEHIVLRHWATSGATGVGKFDPGTTTRALRGFLRRLSKAEFLGQTLGDELAALSSMTSVAKSGPMYLDKPQRRFAWF